MYILQCLHSNRWLVTTSTSKLDSVIVTGTHVLSVIKQSQQGSRRLFSFPYTPWPSPEAFLFMLSFWSFIITLLRTLGSSIRPRGRRQ